MQEYLTELYAHASGPLVSALLLGLLIAIAPCPMTINITAVGFIGKDITHRERILSNGIFYALGTIVSYTGLALLLYLGADQFKISRIFQHYSEWIIGPLLIIIGLLMTGVIRIDFPVFSKITRKFENRKSFRAWDSFLLGMILALAFCPYSGVLYFGMLVPLILTTSSPWLSLIFSLTAAIPIVLFAWLLAFTVSGVGKLFNSLQRFEFWFRKIVAFLFIGIGLYYTILVIR
ncbi:MAG: aromatic aminobenezylarsenical efflux permease ArsG family transporter [Bacteroidales bacterium]